MKKWLPFFLLSVSLHANAVAAVEKYSLTVNAIPFDSRIRIMNIKPKYYSGIKLKPGHYNILVDKPGYYLERKWVTIEDRGVTIPVVLTKEAIIVTLPPSYNVMIMLDNDLLWMLQKLISP